jgi:hypothetical protein
MDRLQYLNYLKMKVFLSTLTIGITLAGLSGCTSPTRQHMRLADSLLLQSEDAMVSGEWDQAIAIADQARAEVKLGVDARPERRGTTGEKLDISPLFSAWVNGPHKELISALSAKENERAATAYTAVRQQCTTCHITVGRSNIPISSAHQ